MNNLQNKTIGLVGAGNISFSAHLPLLTAMGARVAWVMDISQKAAIATAKAYQIGKALSPDQSNEADHTDVVLITSPYGSRQPYYDWLRDRRSAIYLEKPVAKSLSEWQSIVGLRPHHAICSGFQRRSTGIVQVVKNIVSDGFFGQLRHIKSHFGTVTQISSGGGFAKNLQLAGGGQLFESAIHNLDAICHICQIENAMAVRKNMIHEEGFDLHTEASFELTTGQGHKIGFDMLVTCFKSVGYDLVFSFEKGTLTFSLFKDMKPTFQPIGSANRYSVLDVRHVDFPNKQYDVLYAFWSDFLAGLESGKPNYTNLSDTRATTSIIEQLYN